MLVHEGGFRVERASGGRLRFFNRHGMPLLERPDAVRLADAMSASLVRSNRRRGFRPAEFAAMALSRKVPWEVELRAMEAVDPA